MFINPSTCRLLLSVSIRQCFRNSEWRLYLPDYLLFSFTVTRKEEVMAIKSKFPTKIPVSVYRNLKINY